MPGGITTALTPKAVTPSPLRALRKPGPTLTLGYSLEVSIGMIPSCVLVVGDEAALGRQRTFLLGPAKETAAQRVCLEARGPERLCGHLRARPDAAVEHHRPLAVDAVRGRRELDQLDVARALDVPRLTLVRLARVDHLDGVALLDQCRESRGLDLDRGRSVRWAHSTERSGPEEAGAIA